MPKIKYKCENCFKDFIDYNFKKRKYCSQFCNGSRLVNSFSGRHHTLETKKKLSEIQKNNEKIKVSQFTLGHKKWNHPNVKNSWFKKGSKPKNWQGGVRTASEKIKDDPRYAKWRKAIFIRDDYTCQICMVRGVEFNADHIIAKAKRPDLVFKLTNGRTLCVPCHRKTDNYGGKALR